MPVVSTIIRGGINEEDNVQELEGLSLHPKVDLSRDEIPGDDPTIFSIFTLVTQYRIPAIDLAPIFGVSIKDSTSSARGSLGLGSGISCNVVVLETDEEHSSVCPVGTLIALKRYNTRPVGDEDGGVWTKKIHQWLSQELKVLCHPDLSKHENIIKLRFIAWEEDYQIPHLGLEMATYGTLEDCLQDLRSYSSIQRKSHLSLDIALGLAALASLDLVHGDVKPGNIIICPHPDREIVAKISDLNGVALASDYGSRQFTAGTPAWQPPEVLDRRLNIDWHLADVYAFGMVIATLWSAHGYIPQGGTFLDPLILFNLSHEECIQTIGVWKRNHDFDPQSTIQLGLKFIPAKDVDLPLRDIITNTLSAIPARRTSLSRLLKTYFSSYATEVGRHSSLASFPETTASTTSYWESNNLTANICLHQGFLDRPRDFQTNMVQALLRHGTKLKNLITFQPRQDYTESFGQNEEKLMESNMTQDLRIEARILADGRLRTLVSAANNLGSAYLLGLGVGIDERAGMEWFRIASELGEFNACTWFCPLEQSIQGDSLAQVPRKNWAARGTMHGYSSNASCLRNIDYELYQVAIKWPSRHQWGRKATQVVQIKPYTQLMLKPIEEDPTRVNDRVEGLGRPNIGESALHICAAIGDLALTRHLVSELNADINITNDQNETPILYATRAGHYEIVDFLLESGADVTEVSTMGLSILHCVASMEDERAAGYALIFAELGAKLHTAVEELSGNYLEPFFLGAGTPLFWAALKNKPLLFASLAELHCNPTDQLSPLEYYVLLQTMAKLNYHGILASTLELQSSLVDWNRECVINLTVKLTWARFHRQRLGDLDVATPKITGCNTLTPHQFAILLYHAMDTYKCILLHRRYVHMANFRTAKEQTIRLLLDFGADPIFRGDETAPATALSCSVFTGDTIAFNIFMAELETQGADILSILSDESLFGGTQVLEMAISADSREIFSLLIHGYPHLLEQRDSYGRGPLHWAALMPWSGYTSSLLDLGENPHDRDKEGCTAFLAALARNPLSESGKAISHLIATRADTEQLLGADNGSGMTCFEQLLRCKMDRSFDPIRYFVDTYGKPSIYGSRKITIFQIVLGHHLSLTDNAGIALQCTMLKYFLNMFPEKVDVLGSTGLSPLQTAIMFANLAAVEILIAHSADVNIEIRECFETDLPEGYTPLGIALYLKAQPVPDNFRLEGRRAAETRENNLDSIIDLLIESGAKDPGKNADSAIQKDAINLLHGQEVDVRFLKRSIRMQEVEWPKKLPGQANETKPFQSTDLLKSRIEILKPDGLSEFCGLQDIVAMLHDKRPPRVAYGNCMRKPEPPDDYMESLQSSISTKSLESCDSEELSYLSGNMLLSGWEVRMTKKGKVYYEDHNTRTTSWEAPKAELD
ncbi:hypothetical protein H9Q72_010325 [Fusarium xylarioides]|uniref:Serine/threonine protein kinase n=1 Tax=Fusarium xylarioides TaxID=221167 RepID=A0A9P7KY29_9HYPO|nr:hypothetical protein H9Q72_010325 [Fusarium xylarioides]